MFDEQHHPQISSSHVVPREDAHGRECRNGVPADHATDAAATTIHRGTRNVLLGHCHSKGKSESGMHPWPRSFACLVFHRSSTKLCKATGSEQIATQLHVSLHDAGEEFRCEELGEEGCDYDWLAFDRTLLRPLHTASRETCNAATGQVPAALVCVASRATFIAQSRLFAIGRAPLQTYKCREIDAVAFQVVALAIDDFVAAQARWHAAARDGFSSSCARQLELVQAILASSYPEGRSLATVARGMHCPAKRLSQAFFAATGFTMVAYRNELRMRKGLRLMEETSGVIDDIARRVGFHSGSHFTSTFRRCFGKPPSSCVKSFLT